MVHQSLKPSRYPVEWGCFKVQSKSLCHSSSERFNKLPISSLSVAATENTNKENSLFVQMQNM